MRAGDATFAKEGAKELEVLSKVQNPNLLMRKAVGVELECVARTALPGSVVPVKVIILAGDNTVIASGVFVDLLDSEDIALRYVPHALTEPLRFSHQAMNETFRIAPPFQLAANETKIFEGKFQLPINFQPTFTGRFSRHEWKICARIETGNGDARSDFQSFRVGAGFWC